MSGGLLALLDDIAVLVKTAAVSLDDIALGAAKAGSKSAAVIIDDAAVTPQYVQGLSPKRELPIIWRITKGSLINKFLIIIPIVMILATFAPNIIPFLLILGGSYLAYEGAEKILHWLQKNKHHHQPETTTKNALTPQEQENRTVKSAVTTDLVLSAEIMIISMASIQENNWVMLLGMLALIALGMTILVYGTVGLLIKLDDIGLHLAKNQKLSRPIRKTGYTLAKSMPKVFTLLSIIGTFAMLWVGGHILATALNDLGIPFLYNLLHTITNTTQNLGPIITWLTDTLTSMIYGITAGTILITLQKLFNTIKPKTQKQK